MINQMTFKISHFLELRPLGLKIHEHSHFYCQRILQYCQQSSGTNNLMYNYYLFLTNIFLTVVLQTPPPSIMKCTVTPKLCNLKICLHFPDCSVTNTIISYDEVYSMPELCHLKLCLLRLFTPSGVSVQFKHKTEREICSDLLLHLLSDTNCLLQVEL